MTDENTKPVSGNVTEEGAAAGEESLAAELSHIEVIDTEETGEKPTSVRAFLARYIAIAMSLFQTYAAAIAPFTAMIQRPIHFAFASMLVFLRKPSGTTKFHHGLDALLVVTGAVVGLYWVVNLFALMSRQGSPTTLDIVISALTVIVVLESTRRTIGWALPVISIAFILYAKFGPYMPGIFAHKGYTWERIVNFLYTSAEGIFGTPLGVSSTYIFMFVMLATLMSRTGMGEVFINLAYGLTGRFTGGPAKAAVISSAMFGMVSGAAAANVVATGTFTIPMMKKYGFSPENAGAVEAAASTGGQIMPPMMGATAFIIADMLGITYVEILIAAAIPACLYFLSVFSVIHFDSARLGLKGLPANELPQVRQILFRQGYLLLPIVVLLVLLALDMSALRASFWCILLTYALNILFSAKGSKLGFRAIVDVLADTGYRSLEIATSTACAGIVVGMVALTGIGLKLSGGIVAISGGSLILVLIFSMIASILLGMGLPTSACYIILAVITAPAVINMGVMPLAVHMFIFYFGIMSTITPPVALSAYVAASLAGANPMKTGVKATQFGLAGFIVPYMFIYNPAILMEGGAITIIIATITSVLGIIMLAAGTTGFLLKKLNIFLRIMIIIASFLLIDGGWLTDVIGALILAGIFVWQKWLSPQQALTA